MLLLHRVHAVIITYDITNKTTFANIDRWREMVEEANEDNKDDIVHVLVGCKADLEHQREVKRKLWPSALNPMYVWTFSLQVTEEDGKASAIKMGSRWTETSSKTGYQVSIIHIMITDYTVSFSQI